MSPSARSFLLDGRSLAMYLVGERISDALAKSKGPCVIAVAAQQVGQPGGVEGGIKYVPLWQRMRPGVPAPRSMDGMAGFISG